MYFTRISPEKIGVSSTHITNFVKRLHSHHIPMHSFLMLRHDFLFAEAYYAPYTSSSLHRMFSISKSLTALAIGFLTDEGKIHLDDPIVTYFPEYTHPDTHPWIMNMTIRHMLMMKTCHASTTYKLDQSTNWVASFFTVLPTHPSGTIFHYDTSSAHVLCALIEKLTHMKMLDYIKQKLAVLHLSPASYMLTDPFGTSLGGSGLVATPMDLLKIGYFLLKKGNIEGQQLLNASYIQEATSHLCDTCAVASILEESYGYGYQIWRNRCGFTCYGMGGQLIIILPTYDLVVVTTADTQDIPGGNQVIYDTLFEEIIVHLEDKPLDENTRSSIELSNYLNTLTLPLFSCPDITDFVNKINHKTFVPHSNTYFECFRFEFNPQKNLGLLHSNLA